MPAISKIADSTDGSDEGPDRAGDDRSGEDRGGEDRGGEDRGWLAAIVDSSDDAIISKSLDGTITSWNAGAEAMLGWTAAEVIGKSVMLLLPSDRVEEEKLILGRIRSGQRVKHFDTVRLRRDGSAIPVSLAISPIFDRRGQVVGASKIMRDATERQRAGEQRSLLAAVVESSDDAIISKALDGTITSWNAGAEAMLGWTAAEAIGRSVMLLLPPDRADEEAFILARIRDGQKVNHFDTVRLRRDGSQVAVSLTVSPIRDAQGRVVGASKNLRDIGERQRSEQALKLANETLERRVAERTRELEQQLEAQRQAEAALVQSQKMEAIGQLTGGLAHDFNNLLTVISANLHFISDISHGNDRLRRLADSMQRAVDRAGRLTSQLLAFARRQPLHPQVHRLDTLIDEFVPLVKRALSESVWLETIADPGLWACEIDASQFEATVLNLVINARDAMANGGRLTIAARNLKHPGDDGLAAGKYVALSVADTGSGMTAEVLDHATEPFFTTKEIGKGSGLGLSQVYGFVRQSGGTLRIESRPGEGTCITMLFPETAMVAPPMVESPDPEPAGQPQPARTRAQVLVVEDEPELLDLVLEALQTFGLAVVGAREGEEALAVLDDHPEVALMLSDVVMPHGMNGVDLAREATARRPQLRVLLMSGYPGDQLTKHGDCATFPFLPKPFRPSELGERVTRILQAGPGGASR